MVEATLSIKDKVGKGWGEVVKRVGKIAIYVEVFQCEGEVVNIFVKTVSKGKMGEHRGEVVDGMIKKTIVLAERNMRDGIR